jgi:hypothetical protein
MLCAAHLLGFRLIWFGLLLFSGSAWGKYRQPGRGAKRDPAS